MKNYRKVKTAQKSWSLVTNITYATVPYWYDATYRDLKASIVMPKDRTDGKVYPLIIWICGGAFQVMDKDVWWPQWMELARRGVIVASIEYRTLNEAELPAALQDVKTAIRYFKENAEKYAVDPDKVFISGESAGGALAVMAGVTEEEENRSGGEEKGSGVRGVIDFYGAVDLFSPEISENAPPFLIFHGTEDDLVDIEQSDKLYERLNEVGVRADYYVLEQEGHGADAFYQKEMMDIIYDFIISETEF